MRNAHIRYESYILEKQNNIKDVIKIKLVFDGWHCLSKRQTKDILKDARIKFMNANFIDNSGLLIEHFEEIDVVKFCLETIEMYKNTFNSWDGYELKKISRKILYSYADRKRKLKFSYFKKLIRENNFSDVRVVLSGILYLEPKEVGDLLITLEKDFEIQLYRMDDKVLHDVYRLLLMYAASRERKFSLNK